MLLVQFYKEKGPTRSSVMAAWRFEQRAFDRGLRPLDYQRGPSLKHALVLHWIGRHDAGTFHVAGGVPLPRSLTVGHVYLLHTFVPSPHLSPPFSLVGLKVDCP